MGAKMSEKVYVEQSAVLEALQAAINKQAGKPDALQFVSDILDAPFVPPPADVKPVVRGEWILVMEDVLSTTYRCSHCGNYFVEHSSTLNAWRGDKKFCPNCGADMRKEGEDADTR